MHLQWNRRGRVGGDMVGLQHVAPEECRPHARYARSDGTQRVQQEAGATAPTPAAAKVTELASHIPGQGVYVSFVYSPSVILLKLVL
jgi:hypothetical protein